MIERGAPASLSCQIRLQFRGMSWAPNASRLSACLLACRLFHAPATQLEGLMNHNCCRNGARHHHKCMRKPPSPIAQAESTLLYPTLNGTLSLSVSRSLAHAPLFDDNETNNRWCAEMRQELSSADPLGSSLLASLQVMSPNALQLKPALDLKRLNATLASIYCANFSDC